MGKHIFSNRSKRRTRANLQKVYSLNLKAGHLKTKLFMYRVFNPFQISRTDFHIFSWKD